MRKTKTQGNPATHIKTQFSTLIEEKDVGIKNALSFSPIYSLLILESRVVSERPLFPPPFDAGWISLTSQFLCRVTRKRERAGNWPYRSTDRPGFIGDGDYDCYCPVLIGSVAVNRLQIRARIVKKYMTHKKLKI